MNRQRDSRFDLDREKWLRDELGPAERVQLEAREGLESLARLKAEDEALRRELHAQIPPRVLAAQVAARVDASPGAKRSAWSLALPALAALMLMSVWMVREKPASERGPADEAARMGERSKGLEPQLRVYRKRGSDVERLSEAAQVSAGDVIQLGYVPADRRYGVLLSIDGSGTVTLHMPGSVTESTRLPEGSGERMLGSAYELDAAPRFERFFLVLSAQPLQASEVVASAERLAIDSAKAMSAPLQLPDHVSQRSMVLRKANP